MNPHKWSNEVPYTQLSDGRWVPAQPVPYYRDTRPIYVKIWHVLCLFRNLLIKDEAKRRIADGKLELNIDEWMVPEEPGVKQ